MRETEVRLRRHAVVEPDAGGDPTDEPASIALAPGGRLVVLWTAQADGEATRTRITAPNGVSFPEARMSADVAARVTVYGPQPVEVARIPRLTVSHPYIQLLPGERVLLIGTRAWWRPEPEGPDRNAVAHDADGRVVAEGVFGDGIAGVVTTASGNSWVHYFDEGIFGNFGWGQGDAPPPIGESGLVRFGPDLARAWSYTSGGTWGSMWSNPALNVDGETAWVSYEQRNPIVRIDDGRTTGWAQDALARIHALLVDGQSDRIAVFGRPHDDGPRRLTGRLADGKFHPTGSFRLVLPDGSELPERWRLFTQGADLHLLCGREWYRAELDDLF